MPTLNDAINAKQRLCNDIYTLIREFEFAYGVTVRGVDLIRSQTLSDPTERVVAVEVVVEI